MAGTLGTKNDRKLVILLVVASTLSAIIVPLALNGFNRLRSKVGV